MKSARYFGELLVWQLADELRQELLNLTARPSFWSRRRFREQLDDATDSACRNMAEGFGADTHGQFAWFLRISRRSLNEVQDALVSAQEKGIVTPKDLRAARMLLKRIFPALNHLIDYLERTPSQRNRPWGKAKSKRPGKTTGNPAPRPRPRRHD
jgi:four helix bundle protein